MTLGNRLADPVLIVIAIGGEGSDGIGNLVEKRVNYRIIINFFLGHSTVLSVLQFIRRLLQEVAEHSYEADRQEENMFTSIRKYKVRRGSAEELARRVKEGFVPLIRQMQGFRSYYLLDGPSRP